MCWSTYFQGEKRQHCAYSMAIDNLFLWIQLHNTDICWPYRIPYTASFSNGTGSDRGCLLSDLETGGCCGLSGGLFRGCSKKCAPFHYLRVQSITEIFMHIVKGKRIFSQIGVSIRLFIMNGSSIITPQSQLALAGIFWYVCSRHRKGECGPKPTLRTHGNSKRLANYHWIRLLPGKWIYKVVAMKNI